jgi:hypothetical protein
MIEVNTIYFQDWHLYVTASLWTVLWCSFVLFIVIGAVVKSARENARQIAHLTRENTDQRHKITDQNLEIWRLSNELEDART